MNIELSIRDLYGQPVLRLHDVVFSINSILDAPRDMTTKLTYSAKDWQVTTVMKITTDEVVKWLKDLESFNSGFENECLLQESSKRLSLLLEEEEGIISASGSFSSNDYLAEMEFQFETNKDQLRSLMSDAYTTIAHFEELERQSKISFN